MLQSSNESSYFHLCAERGCVLPTKSNWNIEMEKYDVVTRKEYLEDCKYLSACL